MTSGRDFGVVEVPSWAWQRKLAEIQDYLTSVVGDVDDFVWPFLRDNLAVCHCLFSRTSVAITPVFPAVELEIDLPVPRALRETPGQRLYATPDAA